MQELVRPMAEGTQRPQTAARGRLVVLGMHRSGTSACTSALRSMGAYVGRPEELTGQSSENPLGFFERRDIRTICDALLTGASAEWWKVSTFNPSLIPDTVLTAQAGDLRSILSTLDRMGIWAIKEPRLCLLVPALREALGEAVYVHIVRDPVEVAKSLRRRNGIPMQAGLALWEAYNVAIVRNTIGCNRIVVRYEELVADPAGSLDRLRSQLARLGINLDVANSNVIAPELHREHASTAEHRELMRDAQIRLWDRIRAGDDADATVSEAALRTLREFEEDRSELLRLRSRVGELETAKKAARGDHQSTDIKAAAAKLLKLEAALKQLVEEGVASRDARIAAGQASLADAVTQNAKLVEANEALERRIAETNARGVVGRELPAASTRVDLAVRIVARRDARWMRLLEKRDEVITRLVQRLDKANSDFDRLVRATNKAADIGSLARLRSRILSPVRRASEPLATVSDVVAKSTARRLVARTKEQKTIIPDAKHDIDRLPAAIGMSGNRLGRVVFVSAIAGGYDPVLDPGVIDLAADYVLFTDDPAMKSDIWETRSFDFIDADPARTARFVKTHPHLYFRDYDRVIWVDANLRIDCLADELIPAADEDADIVTWRHPLRDCVYVEAEECILREKDDEVTIREHVKLLKGMGYPEDNGLVESSVMAVNVRRPAVADFFADWWRLIDNGSRRDQMSFNPALSLHPGLRLGFLGEKGVDMRTDRRFTYHHHPSYRGLQKRPAAEAS